jgi:hypothetical protein
VNFGFWSAFVGQPCVRRHDVGCAAPCFSTARREYSKDTKWFGWRIDACIDLCTKRACIVFASPTFLSYECDVCAQVQPIQGKLGPKPLPRVALQHKWLKLKSTFSVLNGVWLKVTPLLLLAAAYFVGMLLWDIALVKSTGSHQGAAVFNHGKRGSEMQAGGWVCVQHEGYQSKTMSKFGLECE